MSLPILEFDRPWDYVIHMDAKNKLFIERQIAKPFYNRIYIKRNKADFKELYTLLCEGNYFFKGGRFLINFRGDVMRKKKVIGRIKQKSIPFFIDFIIDRNKTELFCNGCGKPFKFEVAPNEERNLISFCDNIKCDSAKTVSNCAYNILFPTIFEEIVNFGGEQLGKVKNDESKLYEKLIKEYNDFWRPMIKPLAV